MTEEKLEEAPQKEPIFRMGFNVDSSGILIHHSVGPCFTTTLRVPYEVFGNIIQTWFIELSIKDRRSFIAMLRKQEQELAKQAKEQLVTVPC